MTEINLMFKAKMSDFFTNSSLITIRDILFLLNSTAQVNLGRATTVVNIFGTLGIFWFKSEVNP